MSMTCIVFTVFSKAKIYIGIVDGLVARLCWNRGISLARDSKLLKYFRH